MKYLRRRSRPSQNTVSATELLEAKQLLSAVSIAPSAIDGSGNNLEHPDWGSTESELLRLTTADYADGTSAPSGEDRPGAREVSNAVAAQSESVLNDRNLTDFAWIWGQFIDHDIDLSEGADPAEEFNISVPAGDVFFDPFGTGEVEISLSRSDYAEESESSDGLRQQLNAITAFIDGSVIYGSDQDRADALRVFDGGLLKTSDGDLLPFNEDGFDNAGGSDASLFLAGDVRANENVLLTSMHTVFVREHNRIASELAAENPGLTDEQLYQQARALVTAELQAITYNEFLPALLGPDAISNYSGYDPNVVPNIANEFSTAAYRFGHSLLSSELLRLDTDGNVIEAGNLLLQQAFFNPGELIAEGIDAGLRGAASQLAQELDTFIVDDVRNFLFGPPGAGGLDLAALNIQRGRDHGIGDYNQVRIELGLGAVTSFDEITSDPDLALALQNTYGSVDDIDLWVGGLAEDHLDGSSMGPTFTAIITDQFERIRSGDRYWYQNVFSGRQLEKLENTHLSEVIERNTGITGLQTNVFFQNGTEVLNVNLSGTRTDSVAVRRRDNSIEVVDPVARRVLASRPADEVTGISIRGVAGVRERFTVESSIATGNRTMNIFVDGGSGPGDSLVMEGTRRDDIMIVRGSEVSMGDLDVVFQNMDMLILEGSDGDDTLDATASEAPINILNGGRGDDLLLGSDGDDRMFGGEGMDTLRGGPGNDNMSGGAGQDRLYGQAGRDLMNGGRDNDIVMQEADGNRPQDLSRLSGFLQDALKIRDTGNNFENWGGRGERWSWSRKGWLFITPDGNLYQWDGSASANGRLIAELGPQSFENPQLLNRPSGTVTDDDTLFSLMSAAEALRSDMSLRMTGSLFENWAGLGERWIWGRGQWYFITPDGMLYEYDSNSTGVPGNLVAQLAPMFFDDITLLAGS